jgi:mannosyltransferase
MRPLRRPSAIELVLAVTVLGGVLRFATLDVQSIWLDESATMILVHRSFSGMLSHLSASESSPPLYYVLVWIWTRVFGAGPLGFRSFSALVGTATIPVLYAAGAQVSKRIGVWAAVLAAVSPAMYYYSQEARAYGLLILFSAAAFAFWQRALEAPSRRHLSLWAGMSILALLTQYFAAFLFAPQAVILARRVGWRRVAAPAGAVIVVGLALAPLAASQRQSGKVHWIEEASLISRLAETAKLFVVGVYGPIEILAALLGGLICAGVIALLWRRGDRRERSAGRDAATIAIVATALPLLLAASHAVDVYDGRNVIANWVPFALLLACGVGAARAGRAGVLLGGSLCVLELAVITAINLIPTYQRDDWRGVAHTLGTPLSARVIVSEQTGFSPLSIYLSGVETTNAAAVATREIAFVGLRTRHTGSAPSPAVVPITPPPGFRLAGVSRSEAYAVSRFLATHTTAVRTSYLRTLAGSSSAEIIVQR